MTRLLISNLLGLIGAAIGGVVGFYTFGWLSAYGFFGWAIPGAFLGLGCGLLAQHRSWARGIVCAVAGLVLSFVAEWYYHPFLEDGSFSFMRRALEGPQPRGPVDDGRRDGHRLLGRPGCRFPPAAVEPSRQAAGAEATRVRRGGLTGHATFFSPECDLQFPISRSGFPARRVDLSGWKARPT